MARGAGTWAVWRGAQRRDQYAEGLASTTSSNSFQNYLGQNQQIYNMLGESRPQGENAAATGWEPGAGFPVSANQLGLAGAGATASGIMARLADRWRLNALGSAAATRYVIRSQ